MCMERYPTVKASELTVGKTEKDGKSDEDRLREIHDLGNDMTVDGQHGAALLGYLPLAFLQEDHGSAQQ
jgi:hypothetical protein